MRILWLGLRSALVADVPFGNLIVDVTDPCAGHIDAENRDIISHNKLRIIWIVGQVPPSVLFLLGRLSLDNTAVPIQRDRVQTSIGTVLSKVVNQQSHALLSLQHVEFLGLSIGTHNDNFAVFRVIQISKSH